MFISGLIIYLRFIILFRRVMFCVFFEILIFFVMYVEVEFIVSIYVIFERNVILKVS